MEKLEEKTQELVQKKQKLDQTKQEPLDWGYSLGTSVYEEHRQDRQGLHSQTRHCSTTTDRLTRAHKLCLYSGFHEPIKQSRAIFLPWDAFIIHVINMAESSQAAMTEEGVYTDDTSTCKYFTVGDMVSATC